jgi:hypothetical protein
MNLDSHNFHCTFRSIGTTGIIIFERDNILLTSRSCSADLTLGDINERLVRYLRELRKRNIRFGFISLDYPEDTMLREILDMLLRARDASPDFWITAVGTPQDSRVKNPHAGGMWRRIQVAVITQAMERYRINRGKAVFVSGTSSAFTVAKTAGIAAFQYSALDNSRDSSAELTTAANLPGLLPVTGDVRELHAKIEQILGLSCSKSRDL